MEEKNKEMEARIDDLSLKIKNMVTGEFIEIIKLVKNPWRILWSNFLIGIARGLGMAIGVVILGSISIYVFFLIMKRFVDLPVLGNYIALLVTIIKQQMNALSQGTH